MPNFFYTQGPQEGLGTPEGNGFEKLGFWTKKSIFRKIFQAKNGLKLELTGKSIYYRVAIFLREY